MRKELVLILAIVMGAALVVYNWSGASPLIIRSVRGVVKTDDLPAPIAEPARKAPIPNPARKAARVDNSKSAPQQIVKELEATPSAQPGEAAVRCCTPPEHPFPTPEIVRKGTTSKELLAAYGEPDFHVAGSSSGKVVEKFYYINSERSQLTLITVENGGLTSASSLPGPYFQLPGPRRPERGPATGKH